MPPARLRAALAAVAAALLLAACGDGASGGPAEPAAAGAAGAAGAEGAAGGPADPAALAATDPAELTDAQLAGQRLIASFRGTRTPPRALQARIRRGEVAGVILFAENASTLAQAARLTRRLQAIPRPAATPQPLLIMVDQEGGLVRRLRDAPPRASASAQGRGTERAVRATGRATGAALRRAGITVNLAPVADVPRAGSILRRTGRTYGDSAAAVGTYAAAFARGLRDARVEAAVKHFPGFGAARVNTDDAPVSIALPAATLRAVDAATFRFATRPGAARLVMLANATYPALDATRPAALSRAIATGELRGRLGFTGVSVTDDLEATGLDPFGDAGDLALASARAGADLLLHGRTLRATDEAAAALRRALADGRLPRRAAEAAAARVLALRAATAGT